MDLVEANDHLVLRADLPGLRGRRHDRGQGQRPDDLGECKAEHEDRGEGFYRLERAIGNFARSLTLPEGIGGGTGSALEGEAEKE